MRSAVFLDKDGTLLDDVPYNVEPSLMRFAPGAAEALALLAAQPFALFVISNQSGVALGKFECAALKRVETQLQRMFAYCGAILSGTYWCPHHPHGSVARYSSVCDCRKPAPGMLLRAAREHGIDLATSWFIGDILDDIEAGNRAGCRTVLLDNGHETEWLEGAHRAPYALAADLQAAAKLILRDGDNETRQMAKMRGSCAMNTTLPIAPPTLAHARVSEPSPPSPWGDDVKRILCVRLDNLGDVLMTTPAMHALRTSGPARRITLLTSRSGLALAPFLDDVDEVTAYDAPWVAQNSSGAPTPPDEQRMLNRLRRQRFDAAVIFTVYSQSPLPAAMLCYLAGIPRRIAHCRENPYLLLTDWVHEPEPQQRMRHEVQRQLDLVHHVGAQSDNTRMRFAVRPADRHTLAAQLAARGVVGDAGWFVLHPGATAASRRYPPERFGEVVTQLVRDTGAPIFVTGGSSERPVVEAVIRAAAPDVREHLHDLSGALTLGELGALIERAAVLVSNNSGPVHMASALGTPVVDLYALTNPQHTPWQTPQRVLFRDVECRWCYRSTCPQQHHHCLLGVPPDEVAQAALELRTQGAPRSTERTHSRVDRAVAAINISSLAAQCDGAINPP